jgi:hypothetical protein
MDHRDRLRRELDARIERGDPRVVPALDVREKDRRQNVRREEETVGHALCVVGDGDRSDGHGDVEDVAELLELGVGERRLTAREVHPLGKERLDALPGSGRAVRDLGARLPAVLADPDVVERRRKCRPFADDRGRSLGDGIPSVAPRCRQQDRSQQEQETRHGRLRPVDTVDNRATTRGSAAST